MAARDSVGDVNIPTALFAIPKASFGVLIILCVWLGMAVDLSVTISSCVSEQAAAIKRIAANNGSVLGILIMIMRF